ncbi:hypothetical protein RhiirC2_713648 [Rhizophagus irregularis]|uniref:Uncharacterized protein n=1 Tax=Rhizophagus irregularis TaxID=588596 RepID=A0A2N1N2I2_9GLOM|nr:hypothetical protein RhiirC2_713648 [Rhizophagus irregularis]
MTCRSFQRKFFFRTNSKSGQISDKNQCPENVPNLARFRVDWNDASSIYDFMKKLLSPRERERNLLGRKEIVDRGPGSGKSRFLDEVEELLTRKANDSNDENIRNVLTSVTSEVRENFRLVKASDNPAFRQDKKLEWQKFEKFNAKFLALRLSHFKVAGYDKIKLKDLLKGVNISEDLLDIEVVIPEKVKL